MTNIDFTGNLAEDPTLSFTPSGVPVVTLVVIENQPKQNPAGEWVDGEPNRHRVKVWRSQAENVAETVRRGMNVMVKGRLKTEKYEKDGENRYATIVEADAVGVALKFQTATVAKATKSYREVEPAPQEPAGWH